MIDTLPAPIDALRLDPNLAPELGLRWLDADERQQLHAGATEVLRGHGGDGEWNARGLERLTRAVPLALGPARAKRLTGTAADTALFFDPLEPERLGLSLCASMNPLTWATAPATAAGLRELWARYFTAPPGADRLTRVSRTVADFGETTRERIEEALGRGHSMLDDTSWYSAHVDDPWPADLAAGSGAGWSLRTTVQLREAQQEHGGRFPAASFRTLFSRSVIKVEEHPYGLWVVEVRYAPAADGEVVRRVNEWYRSRLPEDLPVDVAGSGVMNGGHTARFDLDERAARGECAPFDVVARLALEPCEPATTVWLRSLVERFQGDAEMLRVLAEAAARYGHDGIVAEIAVHGAGAELAAELVAYLRPRPPEEPPAPEDEDEGEGEDEDELEDEPADEDDALETEEDAR